MTELDQLLNKEDIQEQSGINKASSGNSNNNNPNALSQNVSSTTNIKIAVSNKFNSNKNSQSTFKNYSNLVPNQQGSPTQNIKHPQSNANEKDNGYRKSNKKQRRHAAKKHVITENTFSPITSNEGTIIFSAGGRRNSKHQQLTGTAEGGILGDEKRTDISAIENQSNNLYANSRAGKNGSKNMVNNRPIGGVYFSKPSKVTYSQRGKSKSQAYQSQSRAQSQTNFTQKFHKICRGANFSHLGKQRFSQVSNLTPTTTAVGFGGGVQLQPNQTSFAHKSSLEHGSSLTLGYNTNKNALAQNQTNHTNKGLGAAFSSTASNSNTMSTSLNQQKRHHNQQNRILSATLNNKNQRRNWTPHLLQQTQQSHQNVKNQSNQKHNLAYQDQMSITNGNGGLMQSGGGGVTGLNQTNSSQFDMTGFNVGGSNLLTSGNLYGNMPISQILQEETNQQFGKNHQHLQRVRPNTAVYNVRAGSSSKQQRSAFGMGLGNSNSNQKAGNLQGFAANNQREMWNQTQVMIQKDSLSQTNNTGFVAQTANTLDKDGRSKMYPLVPSSVRPQSATLASSHQRKNALKNQQQAAQIVMPLHDKNTNLNSNAELMDKNGGKQSSIDHHQNEPTSPVADKSTSNQYVQPTPQRHSIQVPKQITANAMSKKSKKQGRNNLGFEIQSGEMTALLPTAGRNNQAPQYLSRQSNNQSTTRRQQKVQQQMPMQYQQCGEGTEGGGSSANLAGTNSQIHENDFEHFKGDSNTPKGSTNAAAVFLAEKPNERGDNSLLGANRFGSAQNVAKQLQHIVTTTEKKIVVGKQSNKNQTPSQNEADVRMVQRMASNPLKLMNEPSANTAMFETYGVTVHSQDGNFNQEYTDDQSREPISQENLRTQIVNDGVTAATYKEISVREPRYENQGSQIDVGGHPLSDGTTSAQNRVSDIGNQTGQSTPVMGQEIKYLRNSEGSQFAIDGLVWEFLRAQGRQQAKLRGVEANPVFDNKKEKGSEGLKRSFVVDIKKRKANQISSTPEIILTENRESEEKVNIGGVDYYLQGTISQIGGDQNNPVRDSNQLPHEVLAQISKIQSLLTSLETPLTPESLLFNGDQKYIDQMYKLMNKMEYQNFNKNQVDSASTPNNDTQTFENREENGIQMQTKKLQPYMSKNVSSSIKKGNNLRSNKRYKNASGFPSDLLEFGVPTLKPYQNEQQFEGKRARKRPRSAIKTTFKSTTNKQQFAEEDMLNLKVSKNLQQTQTLKTSQEVDLRVKGKFSLPQRQKSYEKPLTQIDENFPRDLSKIDSQRNEKVFVMPATFKFGSQFKNKSEEKRFYRTCGPIIKLRHLLVTDPQNSHDYILKFLKQYYTLLQIGTFDDFGLRNFIEKVVQFKGISANLTTQQYVHSCLFSHLETQKRIRKTFKRSTSPFGFNGERQQNKKNGHKSPQQTLRIETITNLQNFESYKNREQSDQITPFAENSQEIEQIQINIKKDKNMHVSDQHDQIRSLSPAKGKFIRQKVRDFDKRGHYIPRPKQNEAQDPVFYNPRNRGLEIFVRQSTMPDLAPIWAEDKTDQQVVLNSFLNSQNIRMAPEVQPQSASVQKSFPANQQLILNQLLHGDPQIKELESNARKDQIMRRNGLLLEHIIHERVSRILDCQEYYKAPNSTTQNQLSKSQYKPNEIWPKRTELIKAFIGGNEKSQNATNLAPST